MDEELSQTREVSLGRTPSVRLWTFWILAVMTIGLILNGVSWFQSKDESQRLVGLVWILGAIYMVIWLLFLRPRIFLRIGRDGVALLRTRRRTARGESFQDTMGVRQDQVAYHFILQRRNVSIPIHRVPEEVREQLLPFLETEG